MSEQTGKYGPLQDEQLAHETQGLVQGGHATHAQEWRDPQAPGEDQPDVDQVLSGDRRGVAPGLTGADVEERSEIARFLGLSAFPGDREALVAVATGNGATDAVLADLRRLPAGREYRNVQDVARDLGIGTETHRT